MPNDIVLKLIEDVAKLKVRVDDLMTWQKWQVSLLIAIVAALTANYFNK